MDGRESYLIVNIQINKLRIKKFENGEFSKDHNSKSKKSIFTLI